MSSRRSEQAPRGPVVVVLAAALASSALACEGIVGDPGASAGGSRRGGVEDPAVAGPRARTPTVRLTAREYDNSLHAIFGDGFPARSGVETLPADSAVGRYDRNVVAVDVRAVELLQELAEANAALVVDRIAELATCAAETRACAETTIAAYGRRLFRRALSAEERTVFLGLYDEGATDGDHRDGYRLAFEALLQSPQFLYRVEMGVAPPTGGAIALSDHEIASRLAFFLWNGAPDDALLDAADRAEVHLPDQVAVQARRMMTDDRFRGALIDFHEQWLGLEMFENVEKDPAVHPEFDGELKGSMLAATRAFVEHVFFEDDARLETLLTAPYAFADARLAAFYGVEAPTSGLARVELDPERRSGLFTEPTVLALYANGAGSDPIQRGLLVREWLMCAPPPPPPSTVLDEIASLQIDYSRPVRERYEATMSEGTPCVGCHSGFNPIGYGFEHYDATGAWRVEDSLVADEHDATVDATADLSNVPGFDRVVVYGVREMMERFAVHESVERCVVAQWYEYALDRTPSRGDRAEIDRLSESFAASGDLRELIVSLVTSEAFRTNTMPSEGP